MGELNQADTKAEGPNPTRNPEMSEIERLKQMDAEITAALKGPMPNIDRALLVADRRDIREAIAKAEGRSAEGAGA